MRARRALGSLLLAAAAGFDPQLSEEARRVAQDVERLRGLGFPQPPVAARADAALQQEGGRAWVRRALAPARLAARGRAWADLGLTDPQGPARLYERLAADLEGFALSADGRQVLVGHDRLTPADFGGDGPADEKALTLLLATGRRPDEPALAHMLVHLLHVLRAGERELPETTDALLALAAWQEGEANLVAVRYLFETMGLEAVVLERGLGPADVLEGRLMPELSSTEPAERDLLEWVYRQGYASSLELYRRGGWGALERAQRERRTTRELLHPESAPAQAEPAELPGPPAEGLRLADADRLGELVARTLVSLVTGQEPLGARAAQGLEADRLLRWEPSAEEAGWTCWWTLWASEIEAREFADAASRSLETRSAPPGRQARLEREGRAVRWWVGPAGSTAARDAGAHLR